MLAIVKEFQKDEYKWLVEDKIIDKALGMEKLVFLYLSFFFQIVATQSKRCYSEINSIEVDYLNKLGSVIGPVTSQSSKTQTIINNYVYILYFTDFYLISAIT